MVEKVSRDRQYEQAVARGDRVYASPVAESACLDRARRRIVVHLDTGATFAFDPKGERSLAQATLEDLGEIVVEGVGTTIRFPALDVDLTVRHLPGFPGPVR